MPVHANGIPAKMDEILEIAGAHGVRVVEDCSHAHGAVYRGRRVGAIGDVGAFSIQHRKILSVGEGGLTNGYCGYVPTEEAFAQQGYEAHRTVYTSRLAKDGGRRIAEASAGMLERLKGEA